MIKLLFHKTRIPPGSFARLRNSVTKQGVPCAKRVYLLVSPGALTPVLRPL